MKNKDKVVWSTEKSNPKEHYTELPLTRKPVNKTAALVTAKGWKDNESVKCFGTQRWETCPPLRNGYDVKETIYQINKSFGKDFPKLNDLTGKVFGQLTVMGMHDWPFSKKVVWIVRCSCGTFEPRKHNKLLNTKGKGVLMCCACSHKLEIQKPEVRAKFGKHK